MIKKKRGIGKVLITTTLAGTAATNVMAQSTTTSAISLKGLFEKSQTFTFQSIKKHPKVTVSIAAVLGICIFGYTIYKSGKYLWNKIKGNGNNAGRGEIRKDVNYNNNTSQNIYGNKEELKSDQEQNLHNKDTNAVISIKKQKSINEDYKVQDFGFSGEKEFKDYINILNQENGIKEDNSKT